MRTNYLLITLFLTLLYTSCSDDDHAVYVSDIENEFTAFNVDNNDQFTGNIANLIINDGGYSNIQVIPVDSTDMTLSVSINKIDDLNYTISSTEEGNQLVQITATDASGNELTGYRRMFFHEHGTTDYNTVEGIVIGFDLNRKLTALHGEPEAIEIRASTTETTVNNEGETITRYIRGTETWYYFSKGFDITIDSRSESIIGMSLFGIEGTVLKDDVSYDIVPYAYGVDGLSSFNTSEGLLMDEVIEKYGEPNKKKEGTTTHVYEYDNVFFLFSSDNVDEYAGKKVSSIFMS
ncbi:MAG: hypothetical protein ABJK28_07775 [Algibacter sp.]